jgi:hypothetical protein
MSEEIEEPIEDIEAKRVRLEKLHRDNVAIENDLRKRNIGVQPWVLVNLRLDMILNVILDEESRYDFEIESAKHVHAILMKIQQDTVGKGPGLLLPQQGLQIA